MKCKGKKNGAACGNVVCETDGKSVFIPLESGRELEVRPRQTLGIICEKCGFESVWKKHKHQ